jgi:subtilase family serine protease
LFSAKIIRDETVKMFYCTVAASASVFLLSTAAGNQILPGHIPEAVVRLHLQPIGRLAATNRLNLAIGLPLRNKEALTNLLAQLYDPTSGIYHHYLTPVQFRERFGPTEQDYEAVINFAKKNGLEVVGMFDNRVLVDVSGKVSDVERAFHVTLRTYQHPRENREFYAPDFEPSVETNVQILDVSGLDNYTLPHPMLHPVSPEESVVPATGSGPLGNYWGTDFRNAFVPGVKLDGTGQMAGLVDFTNGYYASDIATYETRTHLPNVPLQQVLLDNASGVPSGNTAEASLDIDMVVSMATNLAEVVVFEGDIWNDILNTMASSNYYSIKQFNSCWSFGGPGSTSDQILEQMAVQGQSFFMASGDGDAWVNSMDVDWPCDDPWVTSVGGTELTMDGSGASYGSETVWNAGNLGAANAWPPNGNGYWGSGGGVSTTTPIPYWQQSVDMSSNGGSTTMRNIPDVAMVANHAWVIYNNGKGGGFMGTSIAAPLWAGFTALVNEQAVFNGQPSVGFINPAIYTIGNGSNYTSCFHDITVGNNYSSSSPSQFVATAGYDLCTGWGTPNGANLIAALTPTNLPLSITNGLVAYYPFDGNANDASGNGNNGTPFEVDFPADRFGTPGATCRFYGNSSSYINVCPSTSLNCTNEITVALWCAVEGSGLLGPRLVSIDTANGAYEMAFNPSLREFSFDYSPNGSSGPVAQWAGSFTNGQWLYLAGTATRSSATLYVNGVLITNAIGPALGSSGQTIRMNIGRLAHSGYDAFNGKLDDVRIYNRALSASEVQQLFMLAQPPGLSIGFTGSNLALVYSNGVLLQATNILGPWVTNTAASPVTVPPANPAMFFRIKQQSD